LSSYLFAPKSLPITSGNIIAFIECPIFVQQGDLVRAFIFFYHTTDGPVIPSNVSASIYSGKTIQGATPVAIPNLVQWGNSDIGAYVFEYVVPADAPLGLYTLVWNGTYAGASIQFLFPVKVI